MIPVLARELERGESSTVSHHVLSAHPHATREARRHIRVRLAHSLSVGQLADAELLASELVANAVQHAQLQPGATIGIDIDVAPRTVRVSVEDAGPGFRPRKDRRDPGGWGLVLVDKISDRWGVVSAHPHSVWFEIDR